MLTFKKSLFCFALIQTLFLLACAKTQTETQIGKQTPPKTDSALVQSVLPTPKQQPNILWIITDDQRADSIAAFNRSQRGTSESALGYVASPAIDKLAAQGTMFTHAYNNSPACAPSRASMQFGLYPHRSGRFGFEYYHNQHDLKLEPTATTLQKQGYQTTLVGKRGVRLKQFDDNKLGQIIPIYDEKIDFNKDLGHQSYNHGGEHRLFTDFSRIDHFDKSGAKWKKTASYEHYLFPDGRVEIIDQSKVDPNKPTAVEKELDILRSYTRSQSKLILGGVSPQSAGETLDGHILKSFVDYLKHPNEQYKAHFDRNIQGPNTDKPQFLNLGFHFPHTPVLPPKSFRDQFKNRTYKIPNFSKAEVEKLPKQMKKLYQNLKIDGMTYAQKQKAIADYYAFCAYGDYLIGQAVDAFKTFSEKQGRDYLIVLTVGDHGWQLGEQGIEAKFSPWNTSNQGIVIVADSTKQRFPENLVVDDFVEYVDLAPTILQAAGLNASQDKPQLDGFDLAQVIRQPELKRDYVIAELNAIVGPRAYLRGKDFAFSMRVRKENGFPGKAYQPGENINWAYQASDQEVEMGLYDLRCDANEQNNLAYDDKYADITRYFRKKLTDIVIGDGRVEVDWSKPNTYYVNDYAIGAHDTKLAGLAKLDLPVCD